MKLEVSLLILGNTGKLNFSSIKLCKKKKIQKMGKFSRNIRVLLLREMKGGDLVLYKIVSCGLWKELGEPVCQLTVETKKTFEFTPLF